MVHKKPIKVIKRDKISLPEQVTPNNGLDSRVQTKKGIVVATVSQWINEAREARHERHKIAREQFGLP